MPLVMKIGMRLLELGAEFAPAIFGVIGGIGVQKWAAYLKRHAHDRS